MEIFSPVELRRLAVAPERERVSIYVTRQPDAEPLQDPTRLKALLQQAERHLVARGVREVEARQVLGPARRLTAARDFWRERSDGLALFVDRAAVRSYRLPLRFPELVVVAGRFHVTPLLPLLVGDGEFYVLALSQNALRVLRCSRSATEPVPLLRVPRSLGEALRYDGVVTSLQLHATVPAAAGRQSTGTAGRPTSARTACCATSGRSTPACATS